MKQVNELTGAQMRIPRIQPDSNEEQYVLQNYPRTLTQTDLGRFARSMGVSREAVETVLRRNGILQKFGSTRQIYQKPFNENFDDDMPSIEGEDEDSIDDEGFVTDFESNKSNGKIIKKMEKNIKRINESQLRAIIAENVKQCLRENAFDNMSDADFEHFMKHDFANSPQGRACINQVKNSGPHYITPEFAKENGLVKDEYQDPHLPYEIWRDRKGKPIKVSSEADNIAQYKRRPKSGFINPDGTMMQESRLKEIVSETVKKTLNELDWKTYANAARKWANHLKQHPDDPRRKSNIMGHQDSKDDYDIPTDNRLRAFQDAMRNSFNKEYGYNDDNTSYGMNFDTDNIGAKHYYDFVSSAAKDKQGNISDFRDEFDLPDYTTQKTSKVPYRGYNTLGCNKERKLDRKPIEPQYDNVPHLKARNKGNQEIMNYQNGKYTYDKGKGWSLKEDVMDDDDFSIANDEKFAKKTNRFRVKWHTAKNEYAEKEFDNLNDAKKFFGKLCPIEKYSDRRYEGPILDCYIEQLKDTLIGPEWDRIWSLR